MSGSSAFETARISQAPAIAWAVYLNFPAFEAIAGQTLGFSTTQNFSLSSGGVNPSGGYKPILNKAPQGRHQTGRGNDYAEFAIRDPDHSYYTSFIRPYENLIERCEVTIYRAFFTASNVWEAEIAYQGYLKDFTVDDTDYSVKFTTVGDLSRTGFLVGGRILTREKCGTDFNYGGIESAATHICGWQVSQGGPSDHCTKIYNDATAGCLAHNNQHRFYAVMGISSATVDSTGPGDGGIDGGGGEWKCFSEKHFILMADYSLKRISSIKATDEHMGFKMASQGLPDLISGVVYDRMKSKADHIWMAKFDHAELEVKQEHLFYLGSGLFTPVGLLGSLATLGLDAERKPARSSLLSIERSSEILFVYNLWTSTGNYIITDENRQFYYMVHNSKPALTLD